ncbi:MAG: transporter [Chitinophagaceae bacterium]
MAKRIFLFIVMILFYNSLKAQGKKIDTDRPDQTESAFTVPARWIQVETGFTREKISAKTVSWTLPTILSKYGLSKKWELRLLTEYNAQSFSYANYRLTDTFGLLPITVGFKVNLIEEKNLLPRISLIGYTGLNRLSSRKTNAHFGSFFSPGIRFTFQNSLSENAAIGYNFGLEWEDTQEPPTWFYTFAPGFDLGEKWYGYIEAFGFLRKNEAPQHSLDAGIAYYISNNVKIDLSAGFGISKAAPKNYVAVGFSFRCTTKK